MFDAVSKQDVSSIGVVHTDGRPTRWGTEVLVEKDGKKLVVLSVHLKSGCFDRNLEQPTTDHCRTLAKQREPLEAWIDEHTTYGVPFVIAGDFNRRFDVYGQSDHLWQEIDDGEPTGLDLWRLLFRKESDCWRGTSRHHKDFIDFLVFDEQAKALVDEHSFVQLIYDSKDQNLEDQTPSDHCPIAVEMDL